MNKLKTYSELCFILSLILLNFAIQTLPYYTQFYGRFPAGMADVAWAYYHGLDVLLKGNSGGYIEMGLYYFGAAIHEIFGVSILFILKYIYPFLFSLEILGMYLVVRSLIENRMASALSATYIALSPAQCHLSEWHMYKLMLGQTLLLFFIFICISWIKKLENKYLFIAIPLIFVTFFVHLSEFCIQYLSL